ncbi:hypothetical protein [Phnomibacter sp. MR]|uniref:LPD3 domain-containing protein n=1 Tax=Phnomibacter sp. MR TaxID=3042318 RepID=UPI003A7F67C2
MSKTIQVETKDWVGLSAAATRKKVFELYKSTYSKNSSVQNKQKGITIKFDRTGAEKTAYGSRIYPKKAAIVTKLISILKEMTFSSFGNKKQADSSDVLGYLNFQCKVIIDKKRESVKVAIRVKNDGTFHYSIDVNLIKKPS